MYLHICTVYTCSWRIYLFIYLHLELFGELWPAVLSTRILLPRANLGVCGALPFWGTFYHLHQTKTKEEARYHVGTEVRTPWLHGGL